MKELKANFIKTYGEEAYEDLIRLDANGYRYELESFYDEEAYMPYSLWAESIDENNIHIYYQMDCEYETYETKEELKEALKEWM